MDKERIVHAAENFVPRAVVGLAVATLVAGVLRAKGNAPPPPERGGWRNLDPQELETASTYAPVEPEL